ncbi:MAG: transcriptional regulator [Desulfobulbus propionicus]|nr:MAG: transcriptional regulator [Desulfobulbus propionicus]
MTLTHWITGFKERRKTREGELKDFEAARESEQAFAAVKRGVSEIALERIVGTVGRYQDFDRRFRPKQTEKSERYQNILQAMIAGRALPPISLYQIKNDFFILDGHHRFLAARELERTHISAHILELLPSADTLDNRLYLEKTGFRDKAGLANTIELTELDQFVHLEQQIRVHQAYLERQQEKEIGYQEAAADWYRTIYRPLVMLIESSGLVGGFPGRTVDDLYLYISIHQWEWSRHRTYGLGIDQLIPKDMEAFRETMQNHAQASYPEMKREIIVFIMMDVDSRQEMKIIDRLMALDEVREVHSIHGSVDLLVKVVLSRDLLSSDAELINQFTYMHLRSLRGVRSTQTLIPGLSRVREPQQ